MRRFSPCAGLGAALALCGLLAGCAGYAPKPLPPQVAARSRLARLRVDVRSVPLPRLAAQRVDLDAPLPLPAVAALAVLNDPALVAARDAAGVARAQAFAAGLLPDPSFSASRDLPRGAGATSSAYNVSLGFDLGRLITRGAAVDAARAHVRSVDLDILWQEWQTAAAAELDDVRLVGLRERDALIERRIAALALRLRRERAAVAAGELARPVADADLIALQALRAAAAADARQRLALDASLHRTLGLRADVPLRLAGLPVFGAADTQAARAALARLAEIRPDLRALQAAYDSREQRLREAVLAQFPSVAVGFSRARDTSNVHTLGFGVSFNLPLLDGSRGAIAVQRASREQLYDDWRARLLSARAQATQALDDIALLQREQARLAAALPALRDAAAAAREALRRGDITLAAQQRAGAALLEQRLAQADARTRIAEQAVALQLLTGSGTFAAAAPAARD